ncbi:hypothetical protein [Desulfosporosinus sp. SB140]
MSSRLRLLNLLAALYASNAHSSSVLEIKDDLEGISKEVLEFIA